MNSKVLHVLEYTKIIERLADKATSAPGRELCLHLLPGTDLDEINHNQQETADAFSRLVKKSGISFGNNKPLGAALKTLDIGASLSSGELLKIAGLLENTNRVKSYGRKERTDLPDDSLTHYFDELQPLTPVSEELRRCILSEEEISDDASATLRHIRRSISQANDKIRSQLNSMVNGSYRTYLQDAIITMRDNRYCIPVRAEYKSQVPGIVHDQSSTGSTLFIEPSAVVELNNKIRELFLEEDKEIDTILATLSAMVGEHTTDIENNQRIMTTLDFIFAKGSLAYEMNASMPIFNTDKNINIRKGRHPLIDPKKVVPIDIRLGKDFDLLIVTGPNTGGKTVSLKTVGLLTLMGQAGLHIPAGDRSQLSIFTEVYADIGDERSIEQSLSTFSSHMTNDVHILANANEDSLCLFDELGAGTDPTEGAALAIAILDHLHKRGIRTMATTHYSELKVYALSTPYVENACCEFDVETLSPTYRLLIGVPGKSNAFAISSRLGLSDDLIESAKKHITEDKESFEDLLSDLENSRLTIEKEREEIAAYKERIKTLQDQLKNKQDKIEQSKERILREANEKAKVILQDAKDVADETIRTFQKAGPNASMSDLEKSRDKVRNKLKNTSEKLSVKNNAPAHKELKPGQLQLGDSVKIVSMGLRGTVNSLPDAKGNLFVQCGIMRSNVNIKDLILIPDEPTVSKSKTSPKTNAGKIKMSKSFSISPEINLLGKTVDEALSELDKYLDDAYLAHLKSVRIVHGKGTGALRNAVQKHLRKTKYVDSFRLGEFGEGDAGVTIAVFKEK